MNMFVVTRRYPLIIVRVLTRLLLAIALGGLATACAGLPLTDEGDSGEVSTELRQDRLYVDGLSAEDVDQERLEHALSVTDPPVYLAVMPDVEHIGVPDVSHPREYVYGLKSEVGLRGTYVVCLLREDPDHQFVAASDHLSEAEFAGIILDSKRGDDGDPTERLVKIIRLADQRNGGHAADPPDPLVTWDGMRPLVVQAFGVGVGAFLVYFMYRMFAKNRRDEQRAAAGFHRRYPFPEEPYGVYLPDESPGAPPLLPVDLPPAGAETWEKSERAENVRETTEEQITLFGEALAALPVDLSEHTLDPRVRAHVRAGLICYEQAKRGLAMDGSPRLRNATADTWLDHGFHHLTAINALLAGEQPPDPPADLRWDAPQVRGADL